MAYTHTLISIFRNEELQLQIWFENHGEADAWARNEMHRLKKLEPKQKFHWISAKVNLDK